MANRYLKVGGSNLLDGTTLGNAWETCAYAAANLGSTNTLNVDDGSYQTRDTDWTSLASGTSGTDTTVKAINSGQATFILTTGLSFPTRLIQLPSESHYIKFEDMILDGDERSGDLIHYGGSGNSSHIDMDNVTFMDTGHDGPNVTGGMGIQISQATNCETINCTFTRINAYGVYNQNGPNLYRGCTFDTCEKIGITAHSNGETYTGVIIEECLFKNCGKHVNEPSSAVIIASNQQSGAIVRNNIFWDNRRGLTITSNGGHFAYHNIFYDNVLTGMLWSSTGNTIRNNIFSSNGTDTSGSSSGNTLSNNLTGVTATSYWNDPVNGDFTLLDNATTQANAIDQGYATGTTRDYLGNPRPIGAASDIGHIELGTVDPPDAPSIGHGVVSVSSTQLATAMDLVLSDNDSNTLTFHIVATKCSFLFTPHDDVGVS